MLLSRFYLKQKELDYQNLYKKLETGLLLCDIKTERALAFV
jgi:hypothetical protein